MHCTNTDTDTDTDTNTNTDTDAICEASCLGLKPRPLPVFVATFEGEGVEPGSVANQCTPSSVPPSAGAAAGSRSPPQPRPPGGSASRGKPEGILLANSVIHTMSLSDARTMQSTLSST